MEDNDEFSLPAALKTEFPRREQAAPAAGSGGDRVKRPSLPPVPTWLLLLCAFGLVLMLNQVKLPLLGGRLSLGDLGFLLGFVPVFLYCLKTRRGFCFPLCGILSVLGFAVANVISAPGMDGAVEVAQFIQQILCGTMMLGFLVENAPYMAGAAVLLAILGNLGIGCIQAAHLGFGASLAPADVLKLRWGFGGAHTGFFRSPMAYSFFLGMALVWLQPVLISPKSKWSSIFVILITVFVLLSIPNGQMLFLTCLVLLPMAFFNSRFAGVVNLFALALVLFLLVLVLPGERRSAVAKSLTPLKLEEYAGELKTNHLDFAAALKMGMFRFGSGVGSGRYQKFIGRCYGDMPNPAYNDIETDTQAGWGILAGTVGIPATALFFLTLMLGIVDGLKKHLQTEGGNGVALGGAGMLLLAMLGMCVSDPLTRGLAWLIALGLAAVTVPVPGTEDKAGMRLSPILVLLLGALLAGVIAAIAIRKPQADPLADYAKYVMAHIQIKQEAVATENAVFKLLDAGEALKMTAPFEKGSNSQAYKGTVLKIQDEKGKPPEGKEPAMEYGGAEFKFKLDSDANCKIWLRVWWEGSCGNTLNVQIDAEKQVTVGNDAAYYTWHWLEVPHIYDLKAGEHTMLLLNREDGIMFDQCLITNDMQYIPQGVEEQ